MRKRITKNLKTGFLTLTMVFMALVVEAQWTGLSPNPTWTNQSAGIGTLTPMKRLQIVSVETEAVGMDGFPTLSAEPLQLRLSARKLSNYNPTAIVQNPLAPLNPIVDIDWDIDNNQGALEFHYIDNLGPSFRSPFSLSPSGGIFNYDLSVTENFTVNGNSTFTNSITATDITANNLNVNNINISKLTVGNLKPMTNPSYTNYALSVNGTIVSRKEIVQDTDWADKVFQKNYRLMSLSEIEAFVSKYKHLPEIPSEAEVLENGMDVGEINKLLLQKVEELTLHLIEQDKKINALEAKFKKAGK